MKKGETWLQTNANAVSALTAVIVGFISICLSIYSCILERSLYNLRKQDFIPIFQISYSFIDKDNNTEQINISNIGTSLISQPNISIESILEISRFSYGTGTTTKVRIPIFGYWDSHFKTSNLKNNIYSAIGKNNNKCLFDLTIEMLKNKKSRSYSIDKKDYIRINYITITGENKVIYFEDGKLIDSDDYVKNIFVHKKSKIYDIKNLTFADIESFFEKDLTFK